MANPHPVTSHLIPYEPGQSGNPAGRPKNTPLITPAMRRMAAMPIEDLRSILAIIEQSGEVPAGFTVAEAIALTALNDALRTGAFSTGAKSRELVIRRLDGEAAKLDIDVSVGVLVRYVVGGRAE